MSPTGIGVDYCQGRLKRSFDFGVSLTGIVVLSPLFIILAALLLASSGRPVLFIQERIGMGGRVFRLFKFRSMRNAPGAGSAAITASDDRRVTGIGRLLRVTKLDELPQLFNILTGRMSIVGPRPEMPRYVAGYDPRQCRVLDVRPGLTDPATLKFRHEESILASIAETEREAFYIREILPRKLDLNLSYIERAKFTSDLRLILLTLRSIVTAAGECEASF